MDEILEEALNELCMEKEPNEKEVFDVVENMIDQITIAPEFYNIIEDFVTDVRNTFPEYIPVIEKWWKSDVTPEEKEEQCKFVFTHCLKTVPVKIFDILKQNPEMFESEDTEFLPGIVFRDLWKTDISEKTRAVIWKYLQAILNSITSSVKIPGFDENIFEHFQESDIGEKLEETMKTVHSMFGAEIPKEGVEEQFQKMTQGKIGKLAFELAEETAKDLSMDENVTSTQDIFTNLLKNPTKMMNIVKNMGSKLEEKMSAGEIDENEIINEGMEMIQKMKDMPGFGDLSKIFGNFENMIPKDLTNAQKGHAGSKIKQNAKLTKMKERMNRKREKKRDPELEKIENLKKMLG